jgi:3-hydroxyisobutyrate dehydrogenase-like beta-hydroxyacid dehydrogenase
MSQALRIGFIGLGSIGKPMAERLAELDHPLSIWARRPEVLESFGPEVQRAQTPLILAGQCDVIGLCVFDDVAVEEVLFGSEGLIDGLAPGTIVMIHSTVPPLFVESVAERAQAFGVHILDAPISGGPDSAGRGDLTIMLGGDADVIESIRPVLEHMGSTIIRLGSHGAGQRTKLMNNTLLTAQLALAASLVDVANELKIDQEALLQAISTSSGRSFAIEMFRNGVSAERMASSAGHRALAKDVKILRSILENDELLLDVAEIFTQAMDAVDESRSNAS